MKFTSSYQACIRTIGEDLARQTSPGPALRVAVDGRSGVGKSTFSQALVTALVEMGRPAVCIQLDDFHHPRVRRYARGRYSAEGYYRDARDLEALIQLCLTPLGPGGTGRFSTASFDLEADKPVEPAWRQTAPEQIIVVEGTFLLRPELNAHWDFSVYLDAPAEVARERGMGRDLALLGDEAELLYRQRYEGAFSLYEAESSIAISSADWRVDMTSFEALQSVKAGMR